MTSPTDLTKPIEEGRVPLAKSANCSFEQAGAMPSGFNPSRDERPWPLGGYAPGFYSCRCHHCGKEFQGDKRSLECLECAAISARWLLKKGRELREAAIGLHDDLVLWSEYGGPPLPPQVVRSMDALIGLVRDSDGSGEADKTGTGLAEGDSAGRKASPMNNPAAQGEGK